MVRLSKETQSKIAKAEKAAIKLVRKGRPVKNNYRTKVVCTALGIKVEEKKLEKVVSSWVKDPLNPIRDVFFDGYKYWFTTVAPSGSVGMVSYTQEEWDKRKAENRREKPKRAESIKQTKKTVRKRKPPHKRTGSSDHPKRKTKNKTPSRKG